LPIVPVFPVVGSESEAVDDSEAVPLPLAESLSAPLVLAGEVADSPVVASVSWTTMAVEQATQRHAAVEISRESIRIKEE
jgi:hypothetical protein